MENLTNCEQIIMKILWDADEELGLKDVMQRLKTKYNKDWAPQTVSTFLARIVQKGYIQSYRSGRVFLYKIVIPIEDYLGHITNEYVNFWNHGNADEFIETLITNRKLRQDEIDRIKRILKNTEVVNA